MRPKDTGMNLQTRRSPRGALIAVAALVVGMSQLARPDAAQNPNPPADPGRAWTGIDQPAAPAQPAAPQTPAPGQPPAAQRPAGPPPPAQTIAPIDLTGHWVSIVTEDWRWRMVTPPKGDYASVPLNDRGRTAADTWDPAKDEAAGEQCRAYGAAGLMRVPGRVHITWADEDTLRIETEAGTQTRDLDFGPAPASADPPTWQGRSRAQWELSGGTRGQAVRGGSLKVVTTRLRAGYLRKNGVPYSDGTVLTEYVNRVAGPRDDSWLVITTIVEDPQFLTQPFVTSSHFKRLADASDWHPTACSAR